MSMKLVGAWVLGALFLLAGSWIIQNLKFEIGVSELSYGLAVAVAFILFLLAGLAWISVGVATRRDLL
jgi:ABC-type antimicrobial peptide transport system permease subunit